MIHAHARAFVTPNRRADRAASADAAPLLPAAYLRLRREAAGRSIADVAQIIAAVDPTVNAALKIDMLTALVASLEAPGVIARHPETLVALRTAFAFDPDVYRQLATEPAHRHPRICRGCGCSLWDPCTDGDHACAWANDAACTRCLPGAASLACGQ